MGPTGKSRILQIHPTRLCNLRCLHCYSSSAPEERDTLDVALLCEAVTDAASEGYNVVSMSGGEPLLYRPLGKLLRHAHERGLYTVVTSNGIPLDKRRMEMLRDVTDLLAISLDGVPASHNRIRGSDRAFDQMSERLDGVRASGIPMGFIFTLTQHNLHELEWVSQFALEQGAKLLQIHPLEEIGRASQELQGEKPDGLEASFAYLEAARIQHAVGDRMLVQVDLLNRDALRHSPERVYAASQPQDESLPLSDFVSPLIVEADGTVVPLQYGFGRMYALGNLHRAPLRELSVEWRRRVLGSFQTLCRDVFETAITPAEMPFFNWYEMITQSSKQGTERQQQHSPV